MKANKIKNICSGQTSVEYILVIAVLVATVFIVQKIVNAQTPGLIDRAVQKPLTSEAWRGGEKKMDDYYSTNNITVNKK